ncbi:MAG: hypothetical protein DMF64_21850 [Acidobacteria bacterium]|nr:MAG: hypothetical protein DMF64_21850 [Acidobacteriota bacterium]
MTHIGKYCKAYEVARLAGFPGWPDKLRLLPPEAAASPGAEPAPNDYLYLQENFTVTAGIFLGEDVVFDEVTTAWIDFCRTTLKFEVPPDVE